MGYSNVTRFTGMYSGLDTEALVQQLMNAESMKLNRYKRDVIKLGWQQDAYRDIYSNLQTFQSNYLDMLKPETNMRSSSTFDVLSTTIKDAFGQESNAVSVGSGAAHGSYSVDVKQLATNDVYTGDVGSFGNKVNVAKDSTAGFDKTYSVTLDGVTKTITLDDNLNFNDGDAVATALQDALKNAFGFEGTGTANAKITATFDNETISFTTKGSRKLSVAGGTDVTINPGANDVTLEGVFGTNLKTTGDEVKFSINGKNYTFDKNAKIQDVMNKVNEDSSIKLSFDSYNSNFKLESTATGYVNRIEIGANSEFLTENLGFTDENHQAAVDAVAIINGTQITQSSNTFTHEGVNWTLNRTTNEALSVNVSRDVDKVVDSITKFLAAYNEMYSSLDATINTSRPKSSGSYYEPLLDAEKKEMSESEVELWETQAKTGLLYRDSIVTDIRNQMRSLTQQSVKLSDGSTLSLHEIGITTGEWRDGGKLFIQDEQKLRAAIEQHGDKIAEMFTATSTSSDAKTKTSETGISERINNIIREATSTSGAISLKAGLKGKATQTENSISKNIAAQNQKISDLVNMLAKKETYYYNMFASLESAMAKSETQMNSLAGLL